MKDKYVQNTSNFAWDRMPMLPEGFFKEVLNKQARNLTNKMLDEIEPMKQYVIKLHQEPYIDETNNIFGYKMAYEIKELILCKDCKWYGDIGCAIRIVDDSDKPKLNDYCSFSERKDNEID